MSSRRPLVCFRLELTSVDSLTILLRSYVVAGCRWELSIPSAGTTTLRATRYCKGILLNNSYIRLSVLDLCITQPWFKVLQGMPFISQHCIGAINSKWLKIEISVCIHGDCHHTSTSTTVL